MFNLVIAHVLDGFFDGSHALAQGGVATQDDEEGGQEDPLRAPINPLLPPQMAAAAAAATDESQPRGLASPRELASETADAVPPMDTPEVEESAAALAASAGDPDGVGDGEPSFATSSA